MTRPFAHLTNPIDLAVAIATAEREDVIAWLVSKDPNGSFTDEAADAEGCPRLTVDQARGLAIDMIKGV